MANKAQKRPENSQVSNLVDPETGAAQLDPAFQTEDDGYRAPKEDPASSPTQRSFPVTTQQAEDADNS